jgi:SPP1 gp7 family putative phage head morphogenesis protein
MPSELDLIERTNEILQSLEEGAITRIEAALEASYRQLERQILARYPQYSSAAKPGLLATQRALLLMDELKELLPLFNAKLGAQIQQEFKQLLELASQEGISLSTELMRLQGGESFVTSTAAIPIETVAIAAEQSYRRLEKHGAEFAGKATALINQGLIQGWGPQRMIPELRRQLGITKGRAQAIARTEVMNAQNQAAQQNYQKNGIAFVQSISTRDDRTCPLCVGRTGNVYKLGTVQVPYHVLCRCFLQPWKREWMELGLTNDRWINEFKTAAIQELKASGKQPDNGLSPFEKAAGLTKPPEIEWSADPDVSVFATEGRKRQRQLLSDEQATQGSKSAPQKLPANHLVTLNPRYQTDTLDQTLDLLETPGARARVAQFRQFVSNQDIQVVIHDVAQSPSLQLKHVRQSLAYQGQDSSQWDDAELERRTQYDKPGGFTFYRSRHIVVSTNYAEPSNEGFSVNGKNLNRVVEVIEAENKAGRKIWGVASVYPPGKDAYDFLVYVHEMGHQVYAAADFPKRPRAVKKSQTEYGAVNDDEWFAEHFAIWMLDAERYRQMDPIGANLIETSFNKAVAAPKRTI